MGIDAEVLILGPFKEAIERGREAVANAEKAGDEDAENSKLMLKAAQGVLREGERALKRLQPLWDSQVEKYGDAFKNGVGQNEDIEDKRRKLEDILYDFEDYTEADTFELARFADLQAATKALALNVIDLVKKMKLEPPKSAAYSAPATSSSKFPPLPPLPPLPAGMRSPALSSSSPISTAGIDRSHRPRRRPPTPVGSNRGERSPPPRPLLPLESPDRHQAPPSPPAQDAGPLPAALPLCEDALSSSSDAIPQPLRINPPSSRHSRSQANMNMNMNSIRSRRSATSIGTSRSRISLASTGSIESMPPPAYTAPGEALVPASSQSEPTPHASTSGVSTPEQQQQRSRAPSQERRPPTSPLEATSGVHYSVFPSPVRRAGPGGGDGSGMRTTAWVSDLADPPSRSPPPQPLPMHRSSSRYEPPHSQQALQSLQSLTIPEGKAVGVVGVRPKHSSVIDFSPLTPMLSQLQLGQFAGGGGGGTSSTSSSAGPSAASSPSADTSSPGPAERARMSPLSQATSISSSLYHGKPEPLPQLPLQAPDETIETRLDPLRANPTLTPLSLPAAALEQPLPPSPSIPPAIPEEWRLYEPPASIAGFSSSSLASGGSIISSQPPGGPQPREPDTAVGPRSSLYQLHGFCGGAQAFRATAHQDGVRRVAGHVAGVSTATARCARCAYGHAFAELALDVNDKSPRAAFARPGGALFRIRLLYKSHLAADRPSEAFYGCLFCARAGAVPREGEATVFRGADDLLRHLVRHPRPLPEVPGVTVLYGKEILATDPRVHDFDVWLTEDPQPGADADAMAAMATAVAERLPFATASRSHVQRYAEKRLPRPDGKGAGSLLQFFVGARVVGVEFPRALAGKWCTGWHDGEWGYFPAKAVELEKPTPGRLDAPPLQFQAASAASAVSVVARWRWDPAASIRDAAEKGWVGFDKGERITNVGWPVLVEGVGGGGREAWCWSGTNAKGKFGVFPRSHVDEATLRDDMKPATMGAGGDGARKKKEGGGKGSGKSLFGVRRRASTASSQSGGRITEII